MTFEPRNTNAVTPRLKAETRITNPETWNSKHQAPNPKHQTRNPGCDTFTGCTTICREWSALPPQALSSECGTYETVKARQTPNPKHRNPKPETLSRRARPASWTGRDWASARLTPSWPPQTPTARGIRPSPARENWSIFSVNFVSSRKKNRRCGIWGARCLWSWGRGWERERRERSEREREKRLRALRPSRPHTLGYCAYRGGLVFKAHRLWYHST